MQKKTSLLQVLSTNSAVLAIVIITVSEVLATFFNLVSPEKNTCWNEPEDSTEAMLGGAAPQSAQASKFQVVVSSQEADILSSK